MRIVQTILKNVTQHESLKIKFGPGLIGVFGKNGAGKSNMLNMGGYANLTNDFTRSDKPRAENVRYLATKEDKSYIETEWTHDGHDFVLVRGLQNPKRDTLRSALLEKPLHKDGEIDEWIAKLLGTPNYKYVADNFVFIRQKGLTDFLAEDPTARAKGYANLCGTQIAESCWKALGEQITKDAPLTGDVVDNSDEIRKVIGAAEETRRDARKKRNGWKKKLLPEETAAKHQALLDSASERRLLLKQLKTARENLGSDKQVLTRAKALFAATTARVKDKQAEAAGADTKLVAIRGKLQTFNARKKAYENKRRVARELSELVEPRAPEKREPEAAAEEQARERLRELQDQLKRAQSIHKKITRNKVVECPECGTPVAAMHKHLELQREFLTTVPPLIDEASKKLQAIVAERAHWADYRRDRRTYDDRFSFLTQQLAELGDPDPVAESDRAKLADREQHWQGLLAAAQAAEEQLDDEREPMADARAAYKASLKQVQTLREQLTTDKVDKTELDAAKAALASHRKAELRIAVLTERITNADGEIVKKTKELETLQARIAQTARMREWTALLQKMREVLHRENLPKIVHQAYQEQLLPDVNEMLARFKNPFSAEVGQNLSFVVTKPDGTLEKAHGLSGGEQVVFALSFVWAVHSLSAGGLGMLVLDEPTDGLDEDNLRYLREALPQLGVEARNRGLQVIVVTHENALKTVFDQVIELR